MNTLQRYYIRGESIKVEEDETHEFKGHRTLCAEELDPHNVLPNGNPSRAPLSRSVCGFLNAGKGGTIYIGVTDEGTAHGLHLTQDQKDHIEISFGDLLRRFTPAVSKDLIKIMFVPVLDFKDQLATYQDPHPLESVKPPREHLIQTWTYCWCDRKAKNKLQSKIIPPCYVVEIQIKEWNSTNSNYPFRLPQQTLYLTETGDCYYRIFTSALKLFDDELESITRGKIQAYRQILIDRIIKTRYEIKCMEKENSYDPVSKGREMITSLPETDNDIIEDFLAICPDKSVKREPSLLESMVESLKLNRTFP